MKLPILIKFFVAISAFAVTTGAFAESETKFKSVPEMIEDFGDYSKDNSTFEIISEHPLHIRLSPIVFGAEIPRVKKNLVKMAMVYGIYRSFIHTPIEKITVTAVPRKIYNIREPDKGELVPDEKVTLTKTREQALKVLQHFFPGKTFTDLVEVDKDVGSDQQSDLFSRIYYPDQGEPGLEAFFEELTK